MPTLQVTPACSDLLENVASLVAKSKKVVIVTGAGISTNSGIPDFRSEHGLYSLIQQQFDRAEAGSRLQTGPDTCFTDAPGADPQDAPEKSSQKAPNASLNTATPHVDELGIGSRPPKRRRLSDADGSRSSWNQAHEPEAPSHSIRSSPPLPQDSRLTSVPGSSVGSPSCTRPQGPSTRSRTSSVRQLRSRQLADISSPMASNQELAPDTQLPATRASTDNSRTPAPHPRTASLAHAFSSSPLSSPPPVLFDLYNDSQTSDGGSQATSDSDHEDPETDDTQLSVEPFSHSSANTGLKNIKGRDLFDCNIWADPLKTSVFYRFATSLRQKVKGVEPTATHRFIAQLRDVGKLARVYTQNIDEIEKKIGLSTDLKVGAKGRRRKSTKLLLQQQQGEEQGVDANEVENTQSSEENMNGTDKQGRTLSQKEDSFSDPNPSQSKEEPAEATSTGKTHPTALPPDRGVECVFLHGSLHSLRCFVCGKVCDWDEDGRESRTMSGEQPECPHCAGATAARQERGKRALGVGKLRPDIVLYGEEHPQSDLISPIVQHDLGAGPDLLLVLGTSLRVHGLKVMVKEFAKSVHTKGGKVIFTNFTKPSESVWGDIIDYWVEWDCDAWVGDLKDRRPHLWLSPEEALQLEKQKKEAIAEKKEAIAEKKREIMLRRESSNEKKREKLEEKRRQTIDAKPREPPKNPSAMRNDYSCGAYVVHEIFQTLAKIGDRHFDNLGYVAPLMPARERKRPRRSAPASLPTVASDSIETPAQSLGTEEALPTLPAATPALPAPETGVETMGQLSRGTNTTLPSFRPLIPALAAPVQATEEGLPALLPLATDVGRVDPICVNRQGSNKDLFTKAAERLAEGSKIDKATRLAELSRTPTPEPHSILTAVKTQHRRRKATPKGEEAKLKRPKATSRPRLSRPSSETTLETPLGPPKNTRPSRSCTPQQERITLAPIQANQADTSKPGIECLEPALDVSPQSPLDSSMPSLQVCKAQPIPVSLSGFQVPHPLAFSDPLGRLQYSIPGPYPAREESPSAQLRRENNERRRGDAVRALVELKRT